MSFRRTLAAAAATVAAAAGMLVHAPVAMAHDAVLSSVPADSQVVNEFPREIELIFSGDPQANFNTVAVSDADARKVLYSHEPTVVGNQVKLSIPEDINPGPGNYIVGFQITSSDGHSTRGKTSFSVAGEGAADAAGKKIQTQSSDAGAEDTVGIPTWAFGLGGGLIVLIAVVVIAINRKAK